MIFTIFQGIISLFIEPFNLDSKICSLEGFVIILVPSLILFFLVSLLLLFVVYSINGVNCKCLYIL